MNTLFCTVENKLNVGFQILLDILTKIGLTFYPKETMTRTQYITMVLTISLYFQATLGAIKMDETAHTIDLEEGETTTIHCTIKIPADRICNKRIFSWIFVNSSGKEAYIANATGLSRQFAGLYSAAYYEKAIFGSTLQECIFTLELLNASSRLEGRYRCRWSNQMSEEVAINVFPSQESVKPYCSIDVTNFNQSVQEVELVCFASPINPFVKLMWFEEGELMAPLMMEAKPGSLTSKAVLLPRDDSRTDVTYICQAFNGTGHELPGRCSLNCQIDISISATMQENTGQPRGTFKCPFNISLEGIRYERQWLLDGKLIDRHDETDRFIIEGHTGVMHMTHISTEDNGKTLGCTVKTTFGSYSAEMLIAWDMNKATKTPLAGPQSQPFPLMLLIVVVVIALLLVIAINVFVCAVITKSRGRRHRTVGRDVGPHMFQQQEALYASGIVAAGPNGRVVNEGYTPMTDVAPGHYDPEEPYEAMSNGEGKRDSEYQVPKVDKDGKAIKRQQSAKYMNTLGGGGGGGGKSRGFSVFRFTKRKEQKHDNIADMDICTGGDDDANIHQISPNCYAAPQYPPGSCLAVPPSKAAENDYDELNLK